MELYEHDLEELLALRRETWENFPTEMSDFFTDDGSFDYFHSIQENPSLVSQYEHLSYDGLAFSNQPAFGCPMNEAYFPFGDGFSPSEIDKSAKEQNITPFPIQEDCPLVTEDQELSLLDDDLLNSKRQRTCKVRLPQESETPAFQGSYLGKKDRAKKLEGKPSKNLMAERRRRQRLNDRLSMLRSVVPKISKMDRTSILGDTIDYVKELLDRIKFLREEIQVDSNQLNLLSCYNDVKPNELIIRNAPKFDVERRNTDTRIEICCAAKPGLLLSTVTRLEALGLEVEQCVISCFNDFGMQASCSEEFEHRAMVSSEDIKQALFRNAGYGGRCM